jgi:hypothetical protein
MPQKEVEVILIKYNLRLESESKVTSQNPLRLLQITREVIPLESKVQYRLLISTVIMGVSEN